MAKPVLLVVMDGIGFSKTGLGDAVTEAYTPTLDWLMANCPMTKLKAHGDAVGLPTDDDMGNSEVGHNALGCGQIYSQGAKLVNESIESGKMYDSPAWQELAENAKSKNSTMHFIGLLSDGNVHSNISHLINMVKRAKADGISKVRVHALLDGRDVPPLTGGQFIKQLEDVFAELNDATFDARIASGGGRMKITMDRYQADWPMVERGWNTHVKGEGRQFASATEAFDTLVSETGVASDQDLPAFVIAENGEPVGKIVDGDSVILFNFRGDRAIEMSMAFDLDEFNYFDRGAKPDVCYAGMLQYDGDLKLPARFLVNPPEITNTLSEVFVNAGLKQYAISETQKYGHVTYFWNGNKSGKFSEESEEYVEIPSDNVSFDQRPWMKSAEIVDALIEAIKSKKYDFLRCNFPNGDMVGHTGSMQATMIGVESVDIGLARLKDVCDEYGVTMLITADHGNADEMLEKNKKGEVNVRTAHSLNPVPFIIYDKDTKFEIKEGSYGLANVAPTVVKMFGLTAPDCWEDSMI
ncbi:MAG: 2,3-bisphosphoglycerate-independent phosphoglycerate mutase [Oscillospiraceae bacterium]|nr:2,3-bisphosphoglycerate-independent phosphoglycerate mutase [Oscillospiraceae bacterium]MBQ8791048.1 2,3-bisphosphoglycerate-independent phosphoglycerate mutase [Ruminiclostridium sp.]